MELFAQNIFQELVIPNDIFFNLNFVYADP